MVRKAAEAPEPKAVKVLVNSLTDNDGTIYNAGAIVLDASESLLACADSKRTDSDGQLLCKRLSKREALSAAKRADVGDEDVFFDPKDSPDSDEGPEDEASEE